MLQKRRKKKKQYYFQQCIQFSKDLKELRDDINILDKIRVLQKKMWLSAVRPMNQKKRKRNQNLAAFIVILFYIGDGFLFLLR